MSILVGSTVVEKSPKRVIRCNRNRYKTPLFSVDDLGIYLRCKDCRTTTEDGEVIRGAYHLVPWSTLLLLAMGLVKEEDVIHAHAGDDTGSNHNATEGPADDNGDSGG